MINSIMLIKQNDEKLTRTLGPIQYINFNISGIGILKKKLA